MGVEADPFIMKTGRHTPELQTVPTMPTNGQNSEMLASTVPVFDPPKRRYSLRDQRITPEKDCFKGF